MKSFLIYLLFPILAFAQLTDTQRQELVQLNLLGKYNPGFENVKTGWTASGGTFAMGSSGNILIGAASATWDSGSASQTFSSTSVTVPNGLKGGNGLFQCTIMVPSGTATHKLQVYDGSNVIAEQAITSSTTPTVNFVNFGFPSSGSVRGRIISVAADEPLIAIDECYLGKATNVSNVSQAVFIGEAKIAGTSGCAWTRSSATLGAFGTDADCPGPTVVTNPGSGCYQTTDDDLPRFTVNNLPPGTYTVQIKFHAIGSVSSTNIGLAINDGTTTSPGQGLTAQANNRGGEVVLQSQFTYTSSGNKTFEVYGAADANSVLIDNSIANIWDMTFNIYRWPSSSEVAVTIEQGPAYWSGYHTGPNCTFTRTNTAFGPLAGDADCNINERQNSNFGTVISTGGATETPGISFTPKRAGKYHVCANVSYFGAASFTVLRLTTDGSTALSTAGRDMIGGEFNHATMCGIVNASSVTTTTVSVEGRISSGQLTVGGGSSDEASINWTIFPLDQHFPMGQILTVSQSEIIVDSGNGHGSTTGTMIRRFTNTRKSTGTAITYADSATDGGSFTITEAGVYAINYQDKRSGGDCVLGITVNDTAKTTDVSTPVTYAQGLRAISGNPTATFPGQVSWTGRLAIGDVVRAHTTGNPNATDANSMFSIVKVAN
jgi:hypothetical protein